MICTPPWTARPWTGVDTVNGKRITQRGFTAIELLLVLAMVALIASLAMPVVSKSITRAKESALLESLQTLRKGIDDYYADNGSYPPSLETLVDKRYLRKLPEDPVSEEPWELVWRETTVAGKPIRGIADIRSAAAEAANDGSPYNTW